MNAMHLTEEDIDELRRIYKEETGREISEDEAWEMGYRLVRLFDILTRRPGSKGPFDL